MLIHVTADTIVGAWKETLKTLIDKGETNPSEGVFKDAVLALEIEDVEGSLENTYDRAFPMTQDEIHFINEHLLHGTHEEKVIHEWTKLYRRRLVNQEYDQITQVIDYLRQKPQGKRAQASIWNQKEDLYGDIGPCLQILWFQIKDNKLELHVHMRASDAYGKLLMNVNEFAAVQRYVAKELGVECGRYVMFVDTCHIGQDDKEAALAIVS